MSSKDMSLKLTEYFNFSSENYRRLINSSKTVAIRLGYDKCQIGRISIAADYAQTGVSADVTEVRHVRFGDLGLTDAVNNGSNSIEALRGSLQQQHRTLIADTDVVTVIRLNSVATDKKINRGK